MKFPTLYSKDSKGDLRVWQIETKDSEVIVTHGKEGGKFTSKSYFAEGKNAAKTNATSPSEQAEKEAAAKHTLQLKRGYFLTKEEAMGSVSWEPMRCQDYKDFSHKVNYPCYIGPKLDGLRMMITPSGEAFSKSGEPYKIPVHIQKEINDLQYSGLLRHGLDGEIYVEGLTLQEIVSAFRKPNENTKKLCYIIYDIPAADMDTNNRVQVLKSLLPMITAFKSVGLNDFYTVRDEEEGDALFNNFVESGYEGAVYRNTCGKYEHGKRSYDMLKRKPRPTNEAFVQSVEIDKNGQGVLTCLAVNGEQKGAIFKCLMRKDADEVNYRSFENAQKLVGKHIEYAWENLSIDKVPCKPSGVRVRQVDNNGEAIE